MLAAIGRNSRLGESPVIKAAIRSLLYRDDAAADLLPILGRPEFTNAERLSVVVRGWNRMNSVATRSPRWTWCLPSRN